jgi:hypothetical protein
MAQQIKNAEELYEALKDITTDTNEQMQKMLNNNVNYWTNIAVGEDKNRILERAILSTYNYYYAMNKKMNAKDIKFLYLANSAPQSINSKILKAAYADYQNDPETAIEKYKKDNYFFDNKGQLMKKLKNGNMMTIKEFNRSTVVGLVLNKDEEPIAFGVFEARGDDSIKSILNAKNSFGIYTAKIYNKAEPDGNGVINSRIYSMRQDKQLTIDDVWKAITFVPKTYRLESLSEIQNVINRKYSIFSLANSFVIVPCVIDQISKNNGDYNFVVSDMQAGGETYLSKLSGLTNIENRFGNQTKVCLFANVFKGFNDQVILTGWNVVESQNKADITPPTPLVNGSDMGANQKIDENSESIENIDDIING